MEGEDCHHFLVQSIQKKIHQDQKLVGDLILISI